MWNFQQTPNAITAISVLTFYQSTLAYSAFEGLHRIVDKIKYIEIEVYEYIENINLSYIKHK